MKVEIKVKQEIEVKSIMLDVGVRYFEDAIINGLKDTEGLLIPCKSGDRWQPEIELETGKILNWESGKIADIHYKVCDDGKYSLKNEKNEIIYSQESYVPDFLAIEDAGYGDYIIMEVDANGFIKNWDKNIDFETFFSSAYNITHNWEL
jgi:hypothetical protein